MIRFHGALLGALLASTAPALALDVGPTPFSTTVTGGSCPAGQAPNGVSVNGVPTGCFTPSSVLPYTSGLWHETNGIAAAGVAVPASNKVYCVPAVFRAPVTVTDLGSRVATAATGGTRFSVALYASTFISGTGNRPFGAPLASVVDLASNAAGQPSGTLASPVSFLPNALYWQCVWSDGNPVLSATAVLSAFQTMGDTTLGSMPISGTNGLNGVVSATQTYPTVGTAAVFPTFDGTGFTGQYGTLPILGFKAQ